MLEVVGIAILKVFFPEKAKKLEDMALNQVDTYIKSKKYAKYPENHYDLKVLKENGVEVV